jgi:hypothetical protein
LYQKETPNPRHSARANTSDDANQGGRQRGEYDQGHEKRSDPRRPFDPRTIPRRGAHVSRRILPQQWLRFPSKIRSLATHLPVARENSLSYSCSDFNELNLAFGASLSSETK